NHRCNIIVEDVRLCILAYARVIALGNVLKTFNFRRNFRKYFANFTINSGSHLVEHSVETSKLASKQAVHISQTWSGRSFRWDLTQGQNAECHKKNVHILLY